MARITEATRGLLRKKILEKSQDKRDALEAELLSLQNAIDKAVDETKAKALVSIREEFYAFVGKVDKILKSHGLKWRRHYSYDYTVDDIIGENSGKAGIKSDAASKFEAVHEAKDKGCKRLENLRDDLAELDAKRQKACEDIELRVALGAKFDEVMELINNLQS